MTTVDWEEVKRLAADFQKAQLSSTLQTLSERNCIEIVRKLIESKLLDVVFTNDGKEYVTPQHLGKEIKDELYVHGGRINLVELAKILNVNLSQVSKVVNEIEKHNKGWKLILGQLIDRSYICKISEEINDTLNQHGYINVAELTLQYSLPAEFLQNVIEKELGKTIFGRQDTQDPRIFYTEGFVARNKAKIRGALAAITKPTPLSAILGQCSIPERIFFSIWETLQETKQVPGVLTGKHGGSSIYVPTVYSKTQTVWVDNFYKQNGYLEYDALVRLGITDPQSFLKRHFPNETLHFLSTLACNSVITDQVDANIEEVLATSSFVDIYPLLPSIFTENDVEMLLKNRLKAQPNSNVHIFADTFIVSDSYLQKIYKPLESWAEAKAKEFVSSGRYLQILSENKLKSKSGSEMLDGKGLSKKEERRKKATSGKAGGGTQGRETKTKATKKKYHTGKNQEVVSDEERGNNNTAQGRPKMEALNPEDVKSLLTKDEQLADLEDLVSELTSTLHPRLNRHALGVAESLAQTSRITNLNEIEERLNVLATNVRVFDKGIRNLDKSVQPLMSKYLLNSLALDLVNELFKLAAQQNVVQVPEDRLRGESRLKMLQEFPDDVRQPLQSLHDSVQSPSLDDFFAALEPAMASCCLVLRKFDKKKERPIVLAHREALLEQLNATQVPLVALHLTTSVLFTAVTQNALHMLGRHVATVLEFLQPHLLPETMEMLRKFHGNAIGGNQEEAVKELDELKKIGFEYKKQLKTNNEKSN